MTIMKFEKINANAILFLFLGSAILTSSCTGMKGAKKAASAAITATTAGTPGNGSVNFVQKTDGVAMKLEIQFPSKAGQTVAVHIHEHGDCGNSGNDAHGHWNPTKSAHGKWDEGAFHLGDIGNVTLDASGKGTVKLTTSLWSVGTGESSDITGKAIMVHEKADDFTTQPTGDAGARIGCGVIQIAAN